MEKRTLGRSDIEVSPVGFGGWAIGGEFWAPDGGPLGWGQVDDDESIRAVHQALDSGVTFFDTADVYGTGRGERVLGTALEGRRDEVVIATKWGNTFDADRQILTAADTTPGYARQALVQSLRRLRTDHIDLYQLHIGDTAPDAAAELREACEDFVREGLIRAYGWSTDDPARARIFAEGAHCASVQHNLNVLEDNPEMLALCAELNLASVNRGPLAMGLLTGKYDTASRLAPGDIRSAPPAWLGYFAEGGALRPEWRARFDAIREVLSSDGRTYAQGAIAWLWARSPHTVPIPGVRTVAQAEANAGAMEYGPLRPEQLQEIEQLLRA